MSAERICHELIKSNLAHRLKESSVGKCRRGQISLEEYNRRLDILRPFTRIDFRTMAAWQRRQTARQAQEEFWANLKGGIRGLFHRGTQAS